ncbi:unnamed protein product [Ectocarpus fasciculatus]
MINPFIRGVVVVALAKAASADPSFSNVKISQFQQAGLDLSFLVSWDTAYTTSENPSSGPGVIDIWLQTRQTEAASIVETVLQQGVENTGSMWMDAGDSWAIRSSWDSTISGEAIVCVYDSDNLFDNACSEGLGILPEAEAPSATPGDGISNVDISRVDQDGSSLSFSVTWGDGGGDGGFEDTAPFVDIWLVAEQSDPPAAMVELVVEQNVENDMLSHQEVSMDWSTMGWDLTRAGQLQSCVYDTQDYHNYACSDFVAVAATEEGAADGDVDNSSSDGDGGEGGTVLALVLAGGLIFGLVAWLAVTSSRRRQRRRWLGTANEAEALPEDTFISLSDPYSGFH